jgi:hypothetical protein
MANVYKVLGQSAPSATTDTSAYTVPASTEAIISTIVVCNRANSAATFRLAIRAGGASLANQHYIAYDVPIAANDSTTITIGATLQAASIVVVRASTANLSFNIFGTEIS